MHTRSGRFGTRARRLGPLEIAVLDRLWNAGAHDVRGMHEAVGAARGVSRNTIHSTLERLVRKELASRRKIGRAFEYAATVSRSEWIAQAFADLLDFIPGSDPAPVLAAFVDVADRTGHESLDALEHLVRERRRERGERDE